MREKEDIHYLSQSAEDYTGNFFPHVLIFWDVGGKGKTSSVSREGLRQTGGLAIHITLVCMREDTVCAREEQPSLSFVKDFDERGNICSSDVVLHLR